jgi:hypothetical protein
MVSGQGREASASQFALGAFLSLAMSCGGSTSGSATPVSPFAGFWSCAEELATMSLPAGSGSMRAVALTINSPASDQITAVSHADGGAICSLRFATTGSAAVLGPGQSCAAANGGTFAYTMGSATVTGNALTATLSFDLAGEDDAGAPVAQTGTQALTCDRIVTSVGGGVGGW